MVMIYDSEKFKEAQDHGEDLKALHSQRNDMDDAMENMYLVKWDNEDKYTTAQESVAVTRSPSAHNKCEGAIRLLSTTAPKFSVPREKNKKDVDPTSSKIEQWCTRVWECASRVTSEKLERSVAQSQILFGESVIAVDRTSDILDQLLARRSQVGDDWLEAAIVRAERISKQAPFLFTVWDPRTCFPDFDKFGLRAMYREVETTAGAALDEFGHLAGIVEDRNTTITICSYWDYVWRYTWLLGSAYPLIAEKHGLPFIPVVCQLGEGSRLFADPENWRLPFLYSVWRSNQWSNENLYLTVMATATAAFGSNPMFTAVVQNEDRSLIVDHSVPGGRITLLPGESYTPTPKMVIDPSIMTGLERARQDIEESTIYGQTLGEPIGPQATYSMTALLHQAGRLPLSMPQEMAGRAIAGALKIALEWTKKSGKKLTAGTPGYTYDLQPSDIPDGVEIDCKLDVALPQDRLGNVNVARMATDPNNPLTSVAWAQTNVLGIEQPDEMTKEIMAERATQIMFMQYLQQMQQQQQMQQMPPQQGQPTPGPGMPPEMMAGGMQGPQPAPGQQQQLPPEMAGGPGVPYGE